MLAAWSFMYSLVISIVFQLQNSTVKFFNENKRRQFKVNLFIGFSLSFFFYCFLFWLKEYNEEWNCSWVQIKSALVPFNPIELVRFISTKRATLFHINKYDIHFVNNNNRVKKHFIAFACWIRHIQVCFGYNLHDWEQWMCTLIWPLYSLFNSMIFSLLQSQY